MNLMITIRPIIPSDADEVRRRLTAQWGSHLLATRGRLLDGMTLGGFIAEITASSIAGVVTLHLEGAECEVVSLGSFQQGLGVGSALLETAKEYARAHGCERLWLVTSNDNLNALRFYQRRGLRISSVYPGAIDEARATIKPGIPLIGEFGLPMRDEIELEMKL